MEIFTLVFLMAVGAFMLKSAEQKKRIALLGSYLGKHQIEKSMETLTAGYARALDEVDAARQLQILNLLHTTELALSDQFNRFAADFSRVNEEDARVSKLPLAIPFASRLFPGATFDMRKALSIHAIAIARAVNSKSDQSPKGRAFDLSAELFLMQHTCHWFCRSKTVASARMLAGHQTSHAQLVAAVVPDTRQAYCALTGP